MNSRNINRSKNRKRSSNNSTRINPIKRYDRNERANSKGPINKATSTSRKGPKKINGNENRNKIIKRVVLIGIAVIFLAILIFAGIFVPVCGDDENYLRCPMEFRQMVRDIFHLMDGLSDGVKKGGAAADSIVLLRQRLHDGDWEPVVDDVDPVVKQDCGHIDIFTLFSLLAEHSVEAADRVVLQPSHRPASVQNKNQLCHVFSHNECLQSLSWLFSC